MSASLIDGLPGFESSRGYVGWNPHADAMTSKGGNWTSTIDYASWPAFAEGWGANDVDMNLVADFYFTEGHDSRECAACDQSGYNEATKQIADDFYDFAGTGRKWNAAITEDEVAALGAHGRLTCGKAVPSVDEVNAAQARGFMADYCHDAINRWILVETRARRLGVWGQCTECGGEGSIRLSADYIVLNLWMLHPRKGASRGIEVRGVTRDDLPAIREFLRRSWDLHVRHFEWVAR